MHRHGIGVACHGDEIGSRRERDARVDQGRPRQPLAVELGLGKVGLGGYGQHISPFSKPVEDPSST